MYTQIALVSNKNSLKAFERSTNAKIAQLESAGHEIIYEAIRSYPNPIPEKGEIKLLWLAIIPYKVKESNLGTLPYNSVLDAGLGLNEASKNKMVFEVDDE